MVYQEQIMQIFALAGHENPDKMRKIIGKKLVSKMEAERPGFVSGMVANTSIDEEGAERLFDDIATFAEYSFNKSHSVAYARIGWICQYLKIHYPLEWSWALIATSPDKKRRHFAKDAVRRGVNLLSPDVSISGHTLALDRERNAVLGSLSGIKKVGSKAAESIVAAQPFASFDDFMSRVERRAVNAGTIGALARAGALDSLLPNPKFFVDNIGQLFGQMKNKNWRPWEVRVIPDELAKLKAEVAHLEDLASQDQIDDADRDRIAGLEIRIAATEPPLTPWMRRHMIREDDGSYNMNRRRPVTTWADILAGSKLLTMTSHTRASPKLRIRDS
jgi:DNA polymerase III alpha subunit